MVDAAERDRELVTDFEAERARLHEAQMMGITGLATAHQAGLLRHKAKMSLVAVTTRLSKL